MKFIKKTILCMLFLTLIFGISSCKEDTPKPDGNLPQENKPITPTGVNATLSQTDLYLGETVNLTAEVIPSDAKQDVIWD